MQSSGCKMSTLQEGGRGISVVLKLSWWRSGMHAVSYRGVCGLHITHLVSKTILITLILFVDATELYRGRERRKKIF